MFLIISDIFFVDDLGDEAIGDDLSVWKMWPTGCIMLILYFNSKKNII